ncbi:MAG: hypothetical protein AAFN10_04790 [Bacteroidota bacterium]
MFGKLLLVLITLTLTLGLSAQDTTDNRRFMSTNPEYLEWFAIYGDSIDARDPRFPRMQPNPEYLKWLAQREQDSLNRTTLASRATTPAQTSRPIAANPESQADSDGSAPNEQPNRPQKDIILGIAYTATGYYGDLNFSEQGIFQSSFVNFQPGLTATLRRDAARLILPSFHLGYGRFVAQNPDLQPVPYTINERDTLIMPNTYAETDIIHGEFILMINPIQGNAPFKPYLGVGLGGLAFYPKAQDGILLFRKFSTRAPEERSYGTLALTVPVTAGMYFNLNRKLSLHLGYVYRLTTTDYLDNIGLLGRQAGNDQLHSFKLGLDFRIFDASVYENY